MSSNWYSFNEEKLDNAFTFMTEVFKRGVVSGFNELYKRRGEYGKYKVRVLFITSANQGQGMHNI